MRRWFAAALMIAGSALAPMPGAIGQDDIVDRIISVPVPAQYRVDGVRNARVRSDDRVQGGKALRVPVPGGSDQPWTVQVSVPITRAVSAGDNLILAFWARLERGENGAASATLPFNAVQLAADPYTAVFSGPATIGPEWAMHEVRGRADRDYAEGALSVSLHLATGRQTVDIGPVFVLDMGQ
jgi:hypothetical protein